jgi:hypothetical protein
MEAASNICTNQIRVGAGWLAVVGWIVFDLVPLSLSLSLSLFFLFFPLSFFHCGGRRRRGSLWLYADANTEK